MHVVIYGTPESFRQCRRQYIARIDEYRPGVDGKKDLTGGDKVFFCYDESGRVMVCAEENVFPGMEERKIPEGFLPEEQADWRKEGDELVHDPLPREEASLTDRQRIEVLEEENRELKEALELLLSGDVKEEVDE